jgi:polyphosphate kinase
VEQVRHIIDLQLQDDTKTRTVDNSYVKLDTPANVRAQYATYDYLRELVPTNMPEACEPEQQ